MEKTFAIENARERARLSAVVARLSEDDLRMSLDGNWTVAIALAHLAFWDQRALALLRRWRAGGVSPSPIDVEITNEALLPTWSALQPRAAALAAVSAAAAVDHELETAPAALIAEIERLGERSRLYRSMHRRQHLDEIETVLGRSQANAASSDADVERVANDLLQARERGGLIPLPSQGLSSFDLGRGYAVGRRLHAALVERGWQPVGRKIGFTNPATWREFNLDTPIWAHVYDRSVHVADRDRVRLSLKGMASPRIEPEVVLRLSRPLAGGDLNAADVARHLEWVAVGFEIVDSHFPGWSFTAADAVADFGVHAALVIGRPYPVAEPSDRLIAQLEELKVGLRRGGELVAEGEGRNALGSPLLALAHLSRVLASQPWAAPLSAGEIVTTGTLTALPYIHTGEKWTVDIGGVPLQPLTLELAD